MDFVIHPRKNRATNERQEIAGTKFRFEPERADVTGRKSMNLKQILESIVTELEHVGAMVAAVQATLVAQDLITSGQIENRAEDVQIEVQNRLAGVRASIAQLPEQDS
jgi:hypothetical protein